MTKLSRNCATAAGFGDGVSIWPTYWPPTPSPLSGGGPSRVSSCFPRASRQSPSLHPSRKGRDECVIDWKSTTPSVGKRGTLLGFRTRPTIPRSRTLPLTGVQSLGELLTACLFSIPSLSSTPRSASAASLCRGDAIIDEYRWNRTWRVGPANIHHSAHCSCAAAHRAP